MNSPKSGAAWCNLRCIARLRPSNRAADFEGIELYLEEVPDAWFDPTELVELAGTDGETRVNDAAEEDGDTDEEATDESRLSVDSGGGFRTSRHSSGASDAPNSKFSGV